MFKVRIHLIVELSLGRLSDIFTKSFLEHSVRNPKYLIIKMLLWDNYKNFHCSFWKQIDIFKKESKCREIFLSQNAFDIDKKQSECSVLLNGSLKLFHASETFFILGC